MRKFLLIASLLVAIDCFSQTDTQKSQRPKIIMNDSVLTKLRQFDDSIAEDIRKKEEAKEIEQSVQRNADYFVRMQKERRAKEKKQAIIRIGIGIAFLILLIFGMRRRIKK